MLRRLSFRALVLVWLVAEASAHAQTRPAVEPEPDPEVVLSYDSWFMRLDAGAAYVSAVTRHKAVGSDDTDSLEVFGFGPSVQLAIAARLGRDVTLGGLGRLAHAPATSREGRWDANSQGMYYAAAFIDHRLPAKVLRLGGGAGPGYAYTIGPDEERFGGLGPVGTVWLGLDFATSSRVALGLVLDFTATAVGDTHDLEGRRTEFDTFMFLIGLSFTIRISEPSWPDSMPSLAGRPKPPRG